MCAKTKTIEQQSEITASMTNAELADRERELGIKPEITEQQEIDLLKDRISILEDKDFLIRGEHAKDKK